MTNTIETGHTVTIHYKGTLEDGTVFDDSHDREPMSVSVGSTELIEGFTNNLLGMGEGDTKTFTIPSAEAYGGYNESGMVTLPAPGQPDSPFTGQKDFVCEVGAMVPLRNARNEQFVGPIVKITDAEVTVDLNHPLADKDLTFEVEVLTVSGTAIPSGIIIGE